MPKKVDGKWTFSEEEEGDIALASEARYRAAVRLRADDRKEKQDAACAEGKHPGFDAKDKCTYCKADKPVLAPAPTSVRDVRKSLM